MRKLLTNSAYIDGANLHSALRSLGWKLDYGRFRIWLAEKYSTGRAYIFIGYIKENAPLYAYLRASGFELIFKETVRNRSGTIKGNCDADLVLQAVRDWYEGRYEQAIIVSSDGDFTGLAKFLEANQALKVVLSPYSKELCSLLLKRSTVPIAYLNEQRKQLEYK